MIKKINKYIVALVLLTVSTSCLDKYPDNALLDTEAITSVEAADQAVIGIYATFKDSRLYSGLLTALPDVQSDLVYAIDGYTNTYGAVWRWDIQPTNSDIENVYAGLNTVIGRCNFLLDGVTKLEAEVNDEDYILLQEYKGEALFARALAYSELIKLFCKDYEASTATTDLGVVLISDYYYDGDFVRSTLQESYDFVLEDLLQAKELLEDAADEDAPVANSAYFTPYTVDALLARTYLYMDDPENAILYSSNIIDSDKYTLANVNSNNFSTSYNDYEYMWKYDISAEIIWKVGYTETSYGGSLGSQFVGYNPSTGYAPSYVVGADAYGSYATNDLRRTAFFTTETLSYSHLLTWPVLTKYFGNYDLISSLNLYHTNMPKVFRLSEQYLIRAEAYAMSGQYSLASADLLKLREARYSSAPATSLTKDNWLETISEERLKELFMEGFRLNDLKRWKMGFTRTPQSNSISDGDDLVIEATNPLFVWPMPQHEINVPGSEIDPNESNS